MALLQVSVMTVIFKKIKEKKQIKPISLYIATSVQACATTPQQGSKTNPSHWYV